MQKSDFFALFTRFWIFTIGGALASLGAVWWLAERLQPFPDLIVKSAATGAALSGTYELRTGVVFLALSAVAISLIGVIAALVHARRSAALAQRTDAMRTNYNQMLDFARGITAIMYGDVPHRVDVIDATIVNSVFKDGLVRVERKYHIRSVNGPVHRLEVEIEADGQLSPRSGHQAVSFVAKDAETGEELHWIPTTDSPTRKTYMVFFPELAENEEKHLDITYEWYGYAQRLDAEGSTEFWWSHKAATRGNQAKLVHKWVFEQGYDTVNVVQIGKTNSTSALSTKIVNGCQTFTYVDPKSLADRENLRFRVSKV